MSIFRDQAAIAAMSTFLTNAKYEPDQLLALAQRSFAVADAMEQVRNSQNQPTQPAHESPSRVRRAPGEHGVQLSRPRS